ncbi:MAG TPA: polysaccharide biosynthesis tyrosine autokinase [Longimicrobium sp.]
MSELTPIDPVTTSLSERSSRTPLLRSQLTPQAQDESDGIPIRDYLSALRRYWWLVAAAVVLSAGVALWRVSKELPMYLATTSVRLRDASVKMGGDLGATSGTNPDQLPGYYTDPILSQIQVLRSRSVAGLVADSLGLRLRPVKPDFPYAVVGAVRVNSAAQDGDTMAVEFGEREVTATLNGVTAKAPYRRPLQLPGVEATFIRRPSFSSAQFSLVSREDAINAVLNGLTAKPRELTNVIDIAYTAYDRHLAQRVADAAAVSFQHVNTESAQQASRRRALFIREQLRSTDSLLIAAQYQLSQFRKNVNAFSPQEKFRTTQEGLAGLRMHREELDQERRIYAQMGTALGNTRDGGEQLAALAASPQVGTNSGLVSLYQQMQRYQVLRDSLTTGPWSRAATNPDVQRLDSLIASSRNRLGMAVSARSTALDAQVRVMDQMMATDAASVSQLPDAEAEQQRLARQVETLQTLTDDLLREQQKARIDEAVEAGQVEMMDHALVPGGPMPRGVKKRVLFALLIGLMIGAGGAFLLDRLNTALFRREEIEALLHVPVLAIVPKIVPEAEKRRRPGRKLKVPGTALVKRSPAPADALITVTDLHSAGSQAYRKLRTHLIFSTGGDPLRTLLVTSPGASEGKSTVCANLAVTFAQQHMRVLLVDCDMRRSRLHTLFGAERTPGLTEVLARQGTLEEAIRSTQVEGLHILPAGTLVPNISELLGGAGMRAVMAELSSRYDLVVVDTPPVLAAADAEILGVQTDAVLLVLRAGQTDRQPAQYAVQQLRAIGARVVGAVLNDPDEKVADYGRYTYYYDYYSQPANA